MPDNKRAPKKRKTDQTSDEARYKVIRDIERNLARDIKRGCEGMLVIKKDSLPFHLGA